MRPMLRGLSLALALGSAFLPCAAVAAVDPPQDFFTLAPCRVFDSRLPGDAPALSSDTERQVQVTGKCGIPVAAAAVAVNIAVTEPSGAGHVVLYPADIALPPTSNINFGAGQTRAGNGIVELSSSGQLIARPHVEASGTVHLIIDVTGYFVESSPNDAPVVTTTGGTTIFTEDGGAVVVDSGVTVTDADSTNLASATVTITNLLDAGQETLAANTAGTTITASYAAPTLTLSGSDTLDHYQQVLRSVTYNNASNTPNTTTRSIGFTANDGTANSNTATKSVSVTGVNDAPVVTTTGGTTSFTEDGGAVVVDSGVTVTDGDNANLASATVTITNLLDTGQETLAANTAGTAITASYVAPTLTLSGSDTLANYQQVLRTVTYNNASQNPNTTARSIAFAASDGTATSSPATKSVSVTAVNDAPVMTAGGTLNYTENDPATSIDTTITVTDVDSANLVGATAQITGNYVTGQDVLSYTTALGITGTFNAGTGTLTLSGTTTVANYQTALRNVKYNNTSEDPSTLARTVTRQVNDGGSVNNLSNTPTSTINVTAVNDPPVANPVTINAVSGIPIGLPAATLSGTDAEAGTTLTIDTTPANVAAAASVTINPNGSFSFIPPGGATGSTVGFQYRVCDDGRPGPGVCGSYVNVTFNLNGPAIHYVKSAAAGTGNCTLNNECTLATTLTQIGATASRRIFISDSASHTATPTLNDSGWLVGQGVVGTDFDTVMGTAAAVAGITAGATIPSRPAINAARPTVNGTVTAHNNSNVRGLNVNVTGASQGLVASSKSGIVVSELGLTSANGNAVNLSSTSAGFTNFTIAVSGSGGGFVSSGAGTITATQDNTTTVNTISTATGTALSVTNTAIAAGGLTFRSISKNGGANGIVLNTTGAGGLTVTGTGSSGSGGTIQNIVDADAITLNNTGGLVTLKNMIIQDITAASDATAAQNTRSGVDAIQGLDVNGGLTLDNTTIRRISDNAIFGAVFGGTDTATVWNGLTINNSTIEDTNRFNVLHKGDANNEGTVRILGIRGTVNITNSLFQRGAEFLDFFATAGTLTMTVTNSQFLNAYKEFVAADNSPLASVGNHGIDVTVQGSANATVTIGDRNNGALGNTFLNGRLASVRVGNDAGASGTVNVTLGRNIFRSNDHTSGVFCNPGCTSADFDFPMAGVLLFTLGTTSSVFSATVDNNLFDEATNASGGVGQLTLAMTRAVWQALVTNNTFDTPGNAPWFLRADGNTTAAKVKFLNNIGIKGAFCSTDASANGGGCNLGAGQLCPGAAGYCGPGLRTLADTQNGSNLQLTIDGDNFAEHDAGFDPGQTFEARSGVNLVGSSFLCANLLNNTAPDGYSFEQFNASQTVNVFRSGGSGTCTPPGSPGNCQNALQANGNTGGSNNPATNPPFVNVVGTVNVVSVACQEPVLP